MTKFIDSVRYIALFLALAIIVLLCTLRAGNFEQEELQQAITFANSAQGTTVLALSVTVWAVQIGRWIWVLYRGKESVAPDRVNQDIKNLERAERRVDREARRLRRDLRARELEDRHRQREMERNPDGFDLEI